MRAVIRAAALASAGAAVLAGGASASIGITSGPFAAPALAVDSRGDALVSWTASGVRESLFVPPSGQYFHGGGLSGPDLSRPTRAETIPFRVALRRTPDGRFWALQAWQTGPRGVELRFSRWQGAPTQITLELRKHGRYSLLSGRASFHGRPVTGTYTTNSGIPISLAAQLDCFG